MLATRTRKKSSNRMLKVQSAEDIEYLVKESEVVSGKPGRNFVISSADRLTYRIASTSNGYQIQRLDAFGNSTWTQNMRPDDILQHSFSDAICAGQLFTPSYGPSDHYQVFS
jgi:hypothetical protein